MKNEIKPLTPLKVTLNDLDGFLASLSADQQNQILLKLLQNWGVANKEKERVFARDLVGIELKRIMLEFGHWKGHKRGNPTKGWKKKRLLSILEYMNIPFDSDLNQLMKTIVVAKPNHPNLTEVRGIIDYLKREE